MTTEREWLEGLDERTERERRDAAMTDDTMVERMAALQKQHAPNNRVRSEPAPDGLSWCTCGDTFRDLYEHRATALLPLVREAQAEALELAANAWTQGAWADTPRHTDRIADRMGASQFAGDWLRARAATYRTGDDDAR